MTFFDASILGIIEGITEFLPISSTAHLVLAESVLGIVKTDFVKSFDIIIQLGAILAVVTLYWRKFLDLGVVKRVVAGFVPTAVLGFMFYKTVKGYLGDTSVILWALLIGGIIIILFEIWYSKRSPSPTLPKGEGAILMAGGASALPKDSMTLADCIKVGFCQALAFIPGVSRSGATIIGGLSLGISRTTIAEYSFLLAVPTMAAATGLDILKNRQLILESGNFSALIIGFVASYIVALLAIKLFLTYVRQHDFIVFGIYRIVVAILFFSVLF